MKKPVLKENYFGRFILTSKGFSLGELVATTAVMGVLAAVAVPKFTAVRETSTQEVSVSYVESIRTTFSQYYYNQHMLGNPHFPDPPADGLMDDAWAETPIPKNPSKTPASLFSDGKIPLNSKNYPFWYGVTITYDAQGVPTPTMTLKDIDPNSSTYEQVWVFTP